MKGYFADIIIKTSRDSRDTGDKHMNPNNSTVLMGFKNVSTHIIENGDSGDNKTIYVTNQLKDITKKSWILMASE